MAIELEKQSVAIFNEYMSNFETKSLHDKAARRQGAQLVSQGKLLGVQNRGVNAIWLNGANPDPVTEMNHIKGEGRQGRPVALTLELEKLLKMIDLSLLAVEVRKFLELSSDLRSALGSLCFIRAPLKEDFREIVPSSSLSIDAHNRPWIQSWDPHGHEPTEDLIKEIESFGVEYPAVTSMNYSGLPELVDIKEGEAFCKTNNIPLYLTDEKVHPRLRGSYTIITLNSKGVELTRDGNIPGRLLKNGAFKDLPWIEDNVKQNKYEQMEFPQYLTEGLNADGTRMAILLYLEGKDPGDVNLELRADPKFRS